MYYVHAVVLDAALVAGPVFVPEQVPGGGLALPGPCLGFHDWFHDLWT